jgi:hypothetical protein
MPVVPGTSKIGTALASVGLIGDIDTVQQNPLGMEITAYNGNTYVYLAGVASCVTLDAVSFNATTYVAVRLVADAVGRVGIAQGAILAINWGWFLIEGFGTVNSDTVAGAGGLFIDGTTGRVDDASVAGDMIYGMVSTGADVANVCPVQLMRPYCSNTVPA